MRRKYPVEAIEPRFVLHQRRARQVVKIVDAMTCHSPFQCLEQGQQLGYRRLHTAFLEHEEKPGKHRSLLPGGIAPVEEYELFEQVHVLFILE